MSLSPFFFIKRKIIDKFCDTKRSQGHLLVNREHFLIFVVLKLLSEMNLQVFSLNSKEIVVSSIYAY